MGFNKHSRNVTCNLLLSLKQEAKSLIKAPGSRISHGKRGDAGCGGRLAELAAGAWSRVRFAAHLPSWDCRHPGQGTET